ncbi:PhzF family phenazine biosynthesis protein [Mesorhizobium qingshengii]|uniref:Trans-2,3-dihydro-3-hydroxyanthranilate isomerase n=1 Tax=Mesorhizobium qingshengii TaxID=1165689 RepID=A0A1G5ZB59_9HYPH|nr:PhzF family phenazine biosynthesis protein [Mesorhizobium qingshengii]SDA91483.1 trans-2,3-dihydro-3-hydroxyanthranilate isomerase [Mesorhizobium qingshengii]
MQSFHFVIANVFAETHFGGNQLAVFTDARGLSDLAMQSIAKQMNLSETTFVLPARDKVNAAKIRIFTPQAELPFAGHPTVGTAAVLGQRGLGAGQFVLEEAIGDIRVDVELRGDRIAARFQIDRPIDSPGFTPTNALVADLLTLAEADIAAAWFASAGVPFCVVQLAGREAVDRAVLDRNAWNAKRKDLWAPNFLLFAGKPTSERLYARMFAPALGVDEDPATGAAAVALVGSLAKRVVAGDGRLAITIDQGVKMGRPSVIEASVDVRAGQTSNMRVGGLTVILGEGSLAVPSN